MYRFQVVFMLTVYKLHMNRTVDMAVQHIEIFADSIEEAKEQAETAHYTFKEQNSYMGQNTWWRLTMKVES